MNRDKIIHNNDIVITLVTLIILLVVGSMFDFQISEGVAKLGNSISTVVATYAILPICIMVSFLGIQIIANRDCRDKTKDIGTLLTGLVIMVSSIGLTVYNTTLYLDLPIYVNVLIAVIVNSGVAMLIHNITLNSDQEELSKFKKCVMIVIVVVSVITVIGRLLWDRVDYIYLVENNTALFQPWWKISSNIQLTTSESFPSFYVISISLLMMLSLFSRLCHVLRHDERLLFYVGLILSLVCSVILIVGGYIYVSELAISMLIMYLVEIICIKVIYNE